MERLMMELLFNDLEISRIIRWRANGRAERTGGM